MLQLISMQMNRTVFRKHSHDSQRKDFFLARPPPDNLQVAMPRIELQYLPQVFVQASITLILMTGEM